MEFVLMGKKARLKKLRQQQGAGRA